MIPNLDNNWEENESLNKKKLLTLHKRLKFSVKAFLSKCGQIRSFLPIWSHLLRKSLVENFIFLCSLTTISFGVMTSICTIPPLVIASWNIVADTQYAMFTRCVKHCPVEHWWESAKCISKMVVSCLLREDTFRSRETPWRMKFPVTGVVSTNWISEFLK